MADDGKDGSGSTTSRAGCARSALLALGALLIVVYVFTQAGDGGEDAEDEARHSTVTTPEARPTTTLADRPDAVEPECPETDGSSPRTLMFTEAPPMCLEEGVTYVATVATTRGEFEITLDPSVSPNAVNSFVFLSRYHFYDGVTFHRVLRDLLAQAGDPFDPDTGETGAGYMIDQEPPTAEPFYPEGTVAMASESAPTTTGSEFFVVTGEGGELLPAAYSYLGKVTAGANVLDAINATALENDTIGVPSEPTTIESITIDER